MHIYFLSLSAGLPRSKNSSVAGSTLDAWILVSNIILQYKEIQFFGEIVTSWARIGDV